MAIEEFDCQLVLLDDGFQHRRLARDLDIVLLDACEPFGFGHVFPRGLLREPVSGLKRADVVVLSRADMVRPERRAQIRQQVLRYAPQTAWVEVRHAPERWRSASGAEQPVEALAGQPVGAFCGLGNPTGFRHTLRECGSRVQAFREFPDHHLYDRSDVESLLDWAAKLDVAAVVCTHKDLVKLELDCLGDRPLWALVVGIEVLVGQDELEQQLETLLPHVE
jgi:tetraacyldisaccharide 4'-kinase